MIFWQFNHVSMCVSWKTSCLAAVSSLFGSSVHQQVYSISLGMESKINGVKKSSKQILFQFLVKWEVKRGRGEPKGRTKETERTEVDIWFTLVLISIILAWLEGLWSLLSPQSSSSTQQLGDIKWFCPWYHTNAHTNTQMYGWDREKNKNYNLHTHTFTH